MVWIGTVAVSIAPVGSHTCVVRVLPAASKVVSVCRISPPETSLTVEGASSIEYPVTVCTGRAAPVPA